VTPDFVRDIARGAGLRPDPVVRAAESLRDGQLLERAEREAARFGIDLTPSFLLARDGAPLRRVEVTALTPEAFTDVLDRALEGE
jgi:predicted DsbA family dithiol-disulfide isomerase